MRIIKLNNRSLKIETANVVRFGRVGLVVTVLDPATDELLGQWTQMNDRDRYENACIYDPIVRTVMREFK